MSIKAYYIKCIIHYTNDSYSAPVDLSYTSTPEIKNILIDTCFSKIKHSFHVSFFAYSLDGRHVPGFTNAGRGPTIEGLFHDVTGTYSNIFNIKENQNC